MKNKFFTRKFVPAAQIRRLWKGMVIFMKIRRNEQNDVVYLTSSVIENTGIVTHGISTRSGGVSQGFLGAMNLSYTRGDEKERVDENFRRIGAAIGFDVRNLVFTDQTHTANVRIVTEEDRGKGFVRERDYSDVDGLVTNVPGLVLAAFFAACVPLLFVDRVNCAIGIAHSGWRGTVEKIGRRTVELMQAQYGTNPSDVAAAIGPSICSDCYEVSEDVAEVFEKQFPDTYNEIVRNGKEKGKYQLDLWRANYDVLTQAGIPAANIEMPGICTCCNKEFLHSHRGSHGNRGNIGAFLMLNEL